MNHQKKRRTTLQADRSVGSSALFRERRIRRPSFSRADPIPFANRRRRSYYAPPFPWPQHRAARHTLGQARVPTPTTVARGSDHHRPPQLSSLSPTEPWSQLRDAAHRPASRKAPLICRRSVGTPRRAPRLTPCLVRLIPHHRPVRAATSLTPKREIRKSQVAANLFQAGKNLGSRERSHPRHGDGGHRPGSRREPSGAC